MESKRGLAVLPRNRSGSHVGIILSFVIFITFLVFLYTVVRPVANIEGSKRIILEHIRQEIIKNVSSNFTSTSIQINEAYNPSIKCVSLVNFLLPPELNPPHLKIKNEEGVLETAYYNLGTDFTNIRLDRIDHRTTFFKIYQSPEFSLLDDGGTTNCDLVDDEEYQIGLIKVDMYIFEHNLENLISFYETDYDELKEELKISPEDDFWFSFIKNDGSKVEPEQQNVSINVYAEEIPIQYIDENINIQSGYINMRVW